MFLLDAILTHFTLQWRQIEPVERPLPPHIKREYVQTPGGRLELLVCEPKQSTLQSSSSSPSSSSSGPDTKAPIFFAHGGFGHASVWLEWMTYLHEHGYPQATYAFSARNHGASYTLPFWQMVHRTTFEDILADTMYCLEHVAQRRKESTPSSSSTARLPILVGHSSGGGLNQALLSGSYASASASASSPRLQTRASALCLVDSIPHFGSLDLFYNWFLQDPYFLVRSAFHLQHPGSPLSTTQLVHGAFFGHLFPRARVHEFVRWMPRYETLVWPQAMFGRSIADWLWRGRPNEWLDTRDVVRGLDESGSGGQRDREKDLVCVMVGREDMMYRPALWERMCKEYRDALAEAKGRREQGISADVELEAPIDAVSVERGDGVRLALVEQSGHHVQNDAKCDEAAEAFLRWANQV